MPSGTKFFHSTTDEGCTPLVGGFSMGSLDRQRNAMTLPASALEQLTTAGWAFAPRFEPAWSTLRVAQSLGEPFSFRDIVGYERVPTVQRLRPKERSSSQQTMYSGTYGLGAFPLHTDLAYWYLPPRYFVLRCVHGDPSVATVLVDGDDLLRRMGQGLFRRALFQSRRRKEKRAPLLAACERLQGGELVRWDPLFLKCANKVAVELCEQMRLVQLDAYTSKIVLGDPADTLIVDNWRILHGRTEVSTNSTRLLERAYIAAGSDD